MASYNISQIYFDDKSKRNCYSCWPLIFNTTTTPFFENKIIENHVRLSNKDYTGVFSHAFKYKVWLDRNRQQVTPEVLDGWINQMPGNHDVISFFRSQQKHAKNYFRYADKVHGNNFLKPFSLLMERLGFEFNERMAARFVVYQNHFVASTDIYKDYINNVLTPAMILMDEDKELRSLCWENSNYKRSKGVSQRLSNQLTDYHHKLTGHRKTINYYPMHTFLCERLFSYYLTVLKPELKCFHI